MMIGPFDFSNHRTVALRLANKNGIYCSKRNITELYVPSLKFCLSGENIPSGVLLGNMWKGPLAVSHHVKKNKETLFFTHSDGKKKKGEKLLKKGFQ